MKTKIDIKSSVLGAFLGAGLVFSLGAVTGGGKPASWDYRTVPGKVFQGELEKAINAAVSEGWEFVSVCDMSTEQFAFAVMRRGKK
jgi:hypothetical protein